MSRSASAGRPAGTSAAAGTSPGLGLGVVAAGVTFQFRRLAHLADRGSAEAQPFGHHGVHPGNIDQASASEEAWPCPASPRPTAAASSPAPPPAPWPPPARARYAPPTGPR